MKYSIYLLLVGMFYSMASLGDRFCRTCDKSLYRFRIKGTHQRIGPACLPDPVEVPVLLLNKISPFRKSIFPAKMVCQTQFRPKLQNAGWLFFVYLIKNKDSIKRVMLWGIHDGFSWRNNWPIQGRTACPLLFNRDFTPKPAVEAIINLTH